MTEPARRQARIRTLRHEAEGILSIELVPIARERLEPFTPGAHLDIHLQNGLTRCYSLCNDSRENDRYVLGVLQEDNGRGGSRFIHEHLRCGQIVTISPPRNHFPLDESAPATLLIAGGIGITPLLSMFRRLRLLHREVRLVYCARSRTRAAFLPEIAALGGDSQLHFDDEHEGRPLDIHALLADRPAGLHVYCCGPAAMLSAVETACSAAGIGNVHVERFSPLPTAPDPTHSDFVVELARSAKTLQVHPGQSILEAALDAGVDCAYSCMSGICGACETRVLQGRPDHRDSVLSAAEQQSGQLMMICVSRCKDARLVLDL